MMMRTAEQSAKDVELILYVHDGHKGVSESDISLMKHYLGFGIPMMIAYTKTDIMPEENIPADVKKLYEEGIECDILPVSARRGKNIAKLKAAIAEKLPEGEKLFPDDVLSDKSEKFMIAEIMREKILLKYDKEIPHGVAILVNTFKKRETGNIYDIDLDIICEKANHKAILIGKQGKALKETLSFARKSMEEFLGAKVMLTRTSRSRTIGGTRQTFSKNTVTAATMKHCKKSGRTSVRPLFLRFSLCRDIFLKFLSR